MSNYNWRVQQVRVTGKRDGWGSTLVDTPAFELRSNTQFGGIWSSPDSVAKVACGMFAGLTQDSDQIHVSVCVADPVDGSDYSTPTAYVFGGIGA